MVTLECVSTALAPKNLGYLLPPLSPVTFQVPAAQQGDAAAVQTNHFWKC